MNKWDRRFLELAKHIAAWSKDISTKVGAVIADDKHRIISLGYNGLPHGVRDDPGRTLDRDVKLLLTIHAEENAILFASRPLDGCTLYTWPLPPCSNCAGKIVQVGITRVVSVVPQGAVNERWAKSLELAETIYREAGIEFLTGSESA